MKEDVYVVGIIPESQVTGKLPFSEIESVILDCTQLGPFLAPLKEILNEEYGIESFTQKDIEMQTLFKALYNKNFLKDIPLYLNHRETIANVKLVTTSIIIYKKGLLSLKEISAGINAYSIVEKKLKSSNIPLKESLIQQILRLINRTMSEELIRSWIKKCRPQLECEKQDRKQFEKQVRQIERDLKEKKKLNYPEDQDSHDKLFPHEFLFLLCNARNRIDLMNNLPKPEFTIQKTSIKQYDMQPLDARRLDKVYKVELKSMNGEVNYNPQSLLQKVLNNELQGRKLRFDGVKWGYKGSKKGKGEGGSQNDKFILKGLKNKEKLHEKVVMENYQKMLVDPKFYSQIRGQLQQTNQVLSTARLGGILQTSYVNGINNPNYATDTQKLIKHDEGFRSFLQSRPVSANTTATGSLNRRGSRIILNNDKVKQFQKQVKALSYHQIQIKKKLHDEQESMAKETVEAFSIYQKQQSILKRKQQEESLRIAIEMGNISISQAKQLQEELKKKQLDEDQKQVLMAKNTSTSSISNAQQLNYHSQKPYARIRTAASNQRRSGDVSNKLIGMQQKNRKNIQSEQKKRSNLKSEGQRRQSLDNGQQLNEKQRNNYSSENALSQSFQRNQLQIKQKQFKKGDTDKESNQRQLTEQELMELKLKQYKDKQKYDFVKEVTVSAQRINESRQLLNNLRPMTQGSNNQHRLTSANKNFEYGKDVNNSFGLGLTSPSNNYLASLQLREQPVSLVNIKYQTLLNNQQQANPQSFFNINDKSLNNKSLGHFNSVKFQLNNFTDVNNTLNDFTLENINVKVNLNRSQLDEVMPRNKFTFDKFMKDKSLSNEHQKLFSRIDNLLEQEVVRFEMNPNRENSIFGKIGSEMQSEAVKLKEIGGPPITSVFTKPDQKRVNPLEN
eukprot:403345124